MSVYEGMRAFWRGRYSLMLVEVIHFFRERALVRRPGAGGEAFVVQIADLRHDGSFEKGVAR